jgi:hypothetical protein
MAGKYDRAALHFLLTQVFAEGRIVEQGGSSVEFLLELMYATHNIPHILERTSAENDTFSWGGEETDVDTWIRTELLGTWCSELLRSWVETRLTSWA